MNLYSNQKKNKLDNNHHFAYIQLCNLIKYLNQRHANNNCFIFILETLELVYSFLKKIGTAIVPHF